jgi:hypothetical protein
MARTWIAVTVELVSGRGEYYWPRPGRILLAKRSTSFRELAGAIDAAFGRWEGHLHRFVLSDGAEVVPLDWWDDPTGEELDDTRTSVARLSAGEVFAYEFDLGDSWEHICTVDPERVDPEEVYGEIPPGPVVVGSWGIVPDQHGRRWRDDDGETEPPPQPDPPTADLPPLMYAWGPPGAWQAARPSTTTAGQRFDWEPLGWDDAAWRALLAAVHQRDPEGVLEALRRRDPFEVAHLAGDGVLLALERKVGEAFAYAQVLIRRLSERDAPGDHALLDELRAAMGHTDVTRQQPLPIDLDDLAMLLHSGDPLGGWRIDRDSGQWWPDDPEGMTGEPPPAHWEDDDRWLDVGPLGPREGWADMSDFIDTIDDQMLAEELRATIEGRGAFRRFKDRLHRGDEELGRRWQRFNNDRQRGRARQWLAERGYRPVAPNR